jgi:hypothetical protein
MLLRRFEPTTHQCALHMHTRETCGNFSEPSISEQTAVHKRLQLMEFKRWGMPPVKHVATESEHEDGECSLIYFTSPHLSIVFRL